MNTQALTSYLKLTALTEREDFQLDLMIGLSDAQQNEVLRVLVDTMRDEIAYWKEEAKATIRNRNCDCDT